MNILNNWQFPLILVLWGILILLASEAVQFIVKGFKNRKKETKEKKKYEDEEEQDSLPSSQKIKKERPTEYLDLHFHYKVTLQESRNEKIKYIFEEGKQGVVQIKPIFRYDKLDGVEITQLEFKTKLLIQETYYFDEFTNRNLRLKKVEKIIGTQYILVDGASETNPQPEIKNVHYFYLEDIQKGNTPELLELIGVPEKMFEEIQVLFPDFNYSKDFYDKYRENPSVDALLELAHQQISETTGHLTTSYGWFFRDCKSPEYGEDFNTLEEKEDELFGEYIKFFDFYYTYNRYSKKYCESTFDEYLKQHHAELDLDSNYAPRQIKKEKTEVSCKVLYIKDGEVVREIPEALPRFILDQQLKTNGWGYSGSAFQSPRDMILWIDCKHQKTLDYTTLLSDSLIGFDEEKGLPLFHFIDDEVVPLIANEHNWFKANYTSEAKVTSNDWI
ncbi:hypothetical protein ACI1UG_10385 [Lactococcus garvieae]|uniref:hypothetical protein n=1 Tax=Lactococcus garvieae TaxID=1363 RepID=UPI003853F3FA